MVLSEGYGGWVGRWAEEGYLPSVSSRSAASMFQLRTASLRRRGALFLRGQLHERGVARAGAAAQLARGLRPLAGRLGGGLFLLRAGVEALAAEADLAVGRIDAEDLDLDLVA